MHRVHLWAWSICFRSTYAHCQLNRRSLSERVLLRCNRLQSQLYTVGTPQPAIALRLEAVPDMDYDPLGMLRCAALRCAELWLCCAVQCCSVLR